MEEEFWHKCWKKKALGFHQHDVHPFLSQYFPQICLPSDTHIFVPLCGKSLDMLYLAKYLTVTGNELSDIACNDFFIEAGLKAQQLKESKFSRYSFQNMSLIQGDFFSLVKGDIETCDLIYDRAGLIALPHEMQKNYVDHLKTFMVKHTRLILVTLEFPEGQLKGPPFNTSLSRVEELFEGYSIEQVANHELSNKVFAQRKFDVDYLIERLYIISMKA